MSLLGIILIFIIIYFVVVPLVRVWLAVNRARSRARDFFGGGQQHSGQSGQTRSYGYGYGYDQPQRPRRGKKIDADVGEYVDFEEVHTYSSSTNTPDTGSTVHYQREEQIQDVEWEDIPNK